MTALPNMPTREEVEEALKICDASSIDGQFHKVEIFPLIAAARAYLMLEAAHKGNVNTIEHFTNLLNEEKAKGARIEAATENAVDIQWIDAIAQQWNRMFGKPFDVLDGETREEGVSANVGAMFLAAELQVARLRIALEAACIGSCNCSTKTPDPQFHAELCPYKMYRTALASTPPTDVMERVRKMARTLDAIKAHQHLEIHSCPCAFMLDEALEQAKEMGLV